MKCLYCGKSFKPKSDHEYFCSVSCRQSFNLFGKKETTFVCIYCGKTFESKRRKKYCSHECYLLCNGKMRNTSKPKKTKGKKKIMTIAEINEAARSEGLTYGEYVARYKV